MVDPRTPPPRAKPARRPAPRAGSALQRTLSAIRAQRGPSCAELARGWDEIAGPRLASLTKPVRLTAAGPSGVLHVAAVGASAVLVEAESQRILERARSYCGRTIAKRIVVTRLPGNAATLPSTPNTAKPTVSREALGRLEETLEPIANPGLKEALRSLGKSVLTKPDGSDTK